MKSRTHKKMITYIIIIKTKYKNILQLVAFFFLQKLYIYNIFSISLKFLGIQIFLLVVFVILVRQGELNKTKKCCFDDKSMQNWFWDLRMNLHLVMLQTLLSKTVTLLTLVS